MLLATVCWLVLSLAQKIYAIDWLREVVILAEFYILHVIYRTTFVAYTEYNTILFVTINDEDVETVKNETIMIIILTTTVLLRGNTTLE